MSILSAKYRTDFNSDFVAVDNVDVVENCEKGHLEVSKSVCFVHKTISLTFLTIFDDVVSGSHARSFIFC